MKMLTFIRALDHRYHNLKMKHLQLFAFHKHTDCRTVNFIKKPQTKLSSSNQRHRHFYCPLNTRSNYNYFQSDKLNSCRSMSTTNTTKNDDPGLAWKLDKKVYDKGPNQIIPTKAIYTWHADGAVRLQTVKPEVCLFDSTPTSIPQFVKDCVHKNPQFEAYSIKKDGKWITCTNEQYYKDIWTVSKAFIALGLEPHHSVCILGSNSPQWFISHFASIFAGGIACGVYVTNNPNAVGHCGVDSRANIFVVEDDEQLAKLLKIRDKLPYLKAIIKIEEDSSPLSIQAGVISWSQLMKIGQSQSDLMLDDRLRHIAINQCCNLIYTSGTTGKPKGVMLSHDNLMWVTKAFVASMEHSRLCKGDQRMVSYLPVSHIAPLHGDLYFALYISQTMYFGGKDILKTTLLDVMKEAHPTVFLGVPRVYEKMQEGLVEFESKCSSTQKLILKLAKKQALKYHEQKGRGIENPKVIGFKLMDKLIYSRVKKSMGLDACQITVLGAAPLSTETINYFLSLNIQIVQIYGLSETTGAHTYQNDRNFLAGSIGKPLRGAAIDIVNPDEEGVGDMVCGGPGIMMGYINRQDKTEAVFTPDGMILSGDVGFKDSNGFVCMKGRDKDIMVTAGGENIAPFLIEETLKSHLSIVRHAAVIGDKRKCITVLMTLKTIVDSNNEPTDELTPFVQDWIATNGDMKVTTLKEVLSAVDMNSNHKLRQVIERRIQNANREAISRAHHIRNWCILPQDFSITGGELGPTLKLKRETVNKKYSNYIEAMYKHLDAKKHDIHD